MTRIMTLDEAAPAFADCIQDVEAGEEIIITNDGRPVARLSPVMADQTATMTRDQALEGLKAIMDHGWRLDAEPFDRDALHERRAAHL